MTIGTPSPPPAPQDDAAPLVECDDLAAAIARHVDEHGYRLDMIMPADAPRIAWLSREGARLRLRARATAEAPHVATVPSSVIVSRADESDAGSAGRAGMRYRDLIPGRLGGRAIASLIGIPEGGPVADYVHYHHVGFQMIYCRRGWVRVVYEDQGPPFVMHEGDGVLQPPTIRHRVLEASPGLEVVEIASPAEHATWRDHGLDLPTPRIDPQRVFGGQRFVRHVAANASWDVVQDGSSRRDLGMAQATDGRAGACVLRLPPGVACDPFDRLPAGDLQFAFVLAGQAVLRSADGEFALSPDDACTVPAGLRWTLRADAPCDVLVACVDTARCAGTDATAGA